MRRAVREASLSSELMTRVLVQDASLWVGPLTRPSLEDLNRDARHAFPVPLRPQRARRVVLAVAQTIAHHLPF